MQAANLKSTSPTFQASLSWYALWTHSHCEQLVCQQLTAKGFHVLLPQIVAWSSRRGIRSTVQTPMFPGYLFAQVSLSAQYNRVIEAYARRFPDQWFWVHQRWKTKPYQAWPRQ